MRIISFLFVAILSQFPAVIASSNTVGIKVEKVEITNVLVNLQPKLDKAQAYKLADAIHENSVAIEVDWRLAVAILYQESSLNMDPKNCLKRKDCNDLGIAQVRYSVWGKELKIDKKKILTDERYAIDTMFKVLAHYKSLYAKKEFNWFTRYHSNTPELRSVYMRNLNKAYSKINLLKD